MSSSLVVNGNDEDNEWFLTEEDLDDWCMIGEEQGEKQETQIVRNHSAAKKPGTSIFFTSNLFQNTKGKLYNAIRDPSGPAKFSTRIEITLLGQNITAHTKTKEHKMITAHSKELIVFMKFFYSQIWLTYRSGFPSLLNTKISSDMGWGCLIRALQMQIARALLDCYAGRNAFPVNNHMYTKIVYQFLDRDDPEHVLSIHNVMEEAQYFNLVPGDWFDPSRACMIFRNLVKKTTADFPCRIHVSSDSTIRQEIIEAEATFQDNENSENESDAPSEYFQPMIILLPTRIGVGTIPDYFHEQLKFCLSIPFTIGIVGGKKDAAIYFVGYQGDDMIYLDPHHVHNASEIRKKVYHCKYPRKMHISAVDPSIIIGFMVKSKIELEILCFEISSFNSTLSSSEYLILTISK